MYATRMERLTLAEPDHADADRALQATRLLEAVGAGAAEAVDQLLPIVYDELRRIAEAALRNERPGHTLQTTALVHEVYLKLVDQRSAGWKSKAQFLGVAAQAMRRILVDHARGRKAGKRGGGVVREPLDAAAEIFQERAVDLVGLDEALDALAQIDPQKAQIVSMKFFGGMTTEEIAAALNTSVRSVERGWTMARAWLHQEISRHEPTS